MFITKRSIAGMGGYVRLSHFDMIFIRIVITSLLRFPPIRANLQANRGEARITHYPHGQGSMRRGCRDLFGISLAARSACHFRLSTTRALGTPN